MVAVLLYHRQGIAWHINREPIWNNALEWAAKNIRKANIGVKVVYEWVDEPTADLTEVGLALSEREDIQSVIGCNVADRWRYSAKTVFFFNFRRVSRGLENISAAILKITGIIN